MAGQMARLGLVWKTMPLPFAEGSRDQGLAPYLSYEQKLPGNLHVKYI